MDFFYISWATLDGRHSKWLFVWNGSCIWRLRQSVDCLIPSAQNGLIFVLFHMCTWAGNIGVVDWSLFTYSKWFLRFFFVVIECPLAMLQFSISCYFRICSAFFAAYWTFLWWRYSWWFMFLEALQYLHKHFISVFRHRQSHFNLLIGVCRCITTRVK